MEALMTRLTEEEKKKRAVEARKAKLKFMRKHQPKTYEKKILDGRQAFKNWYEQGSSQYPRNHETNEYPRRKQQLEYKRNPKIKARNKIKEAEWRSANRDYINFRARANYRGLFVDKKLWNSFHKLTPQEREEVYKINPEAPAIVRPKGLVLRRVVQPRQTVSEVMINNRQVGEE
jgi:uncharacterized protein YdiU (UPF0061 family)